MNRWILLAAAAALLPGCHSASSNLRTPPISKPAALIGTWGGTLTSTGLNYSAIRTPVTVFFTPEGKFTITNIDPNVFPSTGTYSYTDATKRLELRQAAPASPGAMTLGTVKWRGDFIQIVVGNGQFTFDLMRITPDNFVHHHG